MTYMKRRYEETLCRNLIEIGSKISDLLPLVAELRPRGIDVRKQA